MAAEYQEHFGDHAYDEEGNYIGGDESSEGQQAWEEYYAEDGADTPLAGVIETAEDGTEYEYVEVTEEVEVIEDEAAEDEVAEDGVVEAGMEDEHVEAD